jgi:hypothetical protein
MKAQGSWAARRRMWRRAMSKQLPAGWRSELLAFVALCVLSTALQVTVGWGY